MYKNMLRYPEDTQINLKSVRALCSSKQGCQHRAYLQRYLDIHHSMLQLLHVWVLGSSVGFPALCSQAHYRVLSHKGILKRSFNGQQMLLRWLRGSVKDVHSNPTTTPRLSCFILRYMKFLPPFHFVNSLLSWSNSAFSFRKSRAKPLLSCRGSHCHPSQ